MTDITTPLTELRAAYRAYQNAKRDKKEEIQEKYRTRMEDEIRAAVQAEKYAFASLLKDRKEFYDLRVTDIQDHVLRTRNWKVWEDIRDFADIEPEQIIRENNREATRKANAGYRWEEADTEFGWSLVLTKDEAGNAIEPEAVLTNIYEEGGVLVAWPDLSIHRDVWKKHWNDNGSAMKAYASKLATAHRKEIGK